MQTDEAERAVERAKKRASSRVGEGRPVEGLVLALTAMLSRVLKSSVRDPSSLVHVEDSY